MVQSHKWLSRSPSSLVWNSDPARLLPRRYQTVNYIFAASPCPFGFNETSAKKLILLNSAGLLRIFSAGLKQTNWAAPDERIKAIEKPRPIQKKTDTLNMNEDTVVLNKQTVMELRILHINTVLLFETWKIFWNLVFCKYYSLAKRRGQVVAFFSLPESGHFNWASVWNADRWISFHFFPLKVVYLSRWAFPAIEGVVSERRERIGPGEESSWDR